MRILFKPLKKVIQETAERLGMSELLKNGIQFQHSVATMKQKMMMMTIMTVMRRTVIPK